MKKSIFKNAIMICAIVCSSLGFAQKFPPLDVSPMDASSFPSSYKESNKVVKVTYSRPSLKGRSLDKLAPNDKIWRTGANEASEITFYKDVVFGDKKVAAGTYTMFAIPNEKEWTIILSTAKNVWGSYFYDKAEDVVRVSGKVSKSKDLIEVFSIVFEGEEDSAMMHLGWGNTIVSVPVKG
jgi:hypothetical protein